MKWRKIPAIFIQQQPQFWAPQTSVVENFLGALKVRPWSVQLHYWFSFSPDEKLLGFFHMQEATNDIAMIGLDHSRDDIIATYVSLQTKRSPNDQVILPEPMMIFHPCLSLMIVTYKSGGETYIVTTAAKLHETELPMIERGASTTSVFHDIDGVGISQDGENLILDRAETLPVIRPVGSMLLQYARPPSAMNTRISAQTDAGKVQQSPKTIPTPAQLVPPFQVLASASQVSVSASRGITVSHTGSRITLGAWSRQSTTGTRATLEVLKIPQPTGLDRRSVAVHLPRSGSHHEDKLRVIVNLATRVWNDLDGSLDNASPLLVHRNLAAIRDSRALGDFLRIGNGGERIKNLANEIGKQGGLDIADRWVKVDDESVGPSWDDICGNEYKKEEEFETEQIRIKAQLLNPYRWLIY